MEDSEARKTPPNISNIKKHFLIFPNNSPGLLYLLDIVFHRNFKFFMMPISSTISFMN